MAKTVAMIQSEMRRLAERIEADSQASALIAMEVEAKVAARIRPVFMCEALREELGDDIDSLPDYRSGPEGTNNPDTYLIGKTKKGEPKFGYALDDFAHDLPVAQKWVTYSDQLAKASGKDCPAELSHLKAKGDEWLKAEKRTTQEKLRAAKDLVVNALRIHQMFRRLEQYDTILAEYDMVKDGDGDLVLNEKTTRPFLVRERYRKMGKDGKPLSDTEGEPVYEFTGKASYFSVGEFIGLVPSEAESMKGGFSFENLLKAAAHKREREQAEQSKIKSSSFKNVEEWIKGADNLRLFLDGDNRERKVLSLVEKARKDETVLYTLKEFCLTADVIWENIKDDVHAADNAKREAKNKAAA